MEEWAKLQPPEDVRIDDQAVGKAFEDLIEDAMAGGHFRSEKSTRPGLAGYLGVDHQYGRGDVEIDGETVKNVGVRYKGNGTFIEGHMGGRYSFKIDFNEYVKGQEFRGMTKINLNNNITDPSLMREALSYEFFREASIPARAWVKEGEAHYSGETEAKPVGLYTVVEQKDKRFLRRNYARQADEAEYIRLFRYFGEDWPSTTGLCPRPTPPRSRKTSDRVCRLIHEADDDEFEARYTDYLDVDQFLKFIACNVIVCNLDSFLSGSQNHYIYLEPSRTRFSLPWDMDHSFGAFHLMGTPDTRRNMSIDKPVTDHRPIIARVLGVPGNREKYHGYIEA